MGGAEVTVEAHGCTVVRQDLEDDGGHPALDCPFLCCGKQHPSDAPPEAGKKKKIRASIARNVVGINWAEKGGGLEGGLEGGREGGRKGGRQGGREEGRQGGKEAVDL